jgi:hypothetical protein
MAAKSRPAEMVDVDADISPSVDNCASISTGVAAIVSARTLTAGCLLPWYPT